MKIIRFTIFLLLSVGLYIVLDNPFRGIPPLGRLLSPHQGFWQNAENQPIDLPSQMLLPGIREQVEVKFDQLLIPHIKANSEWDLYYTQGYVTAYHRLWQMDFYSRLVFGRLAEVLGERALEFDRLNRRIGLKAITYNVHDQVMQSPELKIVFEAYTAGVNAYINSLEPGKIPIEFKLINYEPEEWTTLKTCMAYAMLVNTLSRGESDLENTNALSLFGREIFEQLFPEQIGNISPVIPKGTKWDFDPLTVDKPNIDYPAQLTEKTIPRQNPLNGSNNFAVDGTKTRSGNVLLANEPDLQLTSPSIWYSTHLTAPGINVMGVTVPGTPMIVIGFNDSIAWGVTNSPRDQVDWYSVDFRDSERGEYLYENKWFKTETRTERFKVLEEEDFTDTIIYVHHGPVVYDRSFGGNPQMTNYAMRWIAHDSPSSFQGLYHVNRASNYEEFTTALELITGPPQNWIFGSVSGDIALDLPGRFPLKWKEQGKYVMDGSDSDFEWKNYIPHDHRLKKLNSENGYLTSANQHPVDTLYPYYYYDDHYEYYRNRRLNDRLSLMFNVEPSDMMKLQNDNFNYIAFESLPLMLDSLDTNGFDNTELEYYNQLSEWDYFNEPDLVAPSLYSLWSRLLFRSIWDELDTVSVAIRKPHTYVTIHHMKNNPNFEFFDVLGTPSTENAYDLYEITFRQMADSLKRIQKVSSSGPAWYEFKNTRVNHLLQLKPFGFNNIKIGGDRSIVNAASAFWGPSWRMVVDMDDKGIKGYGVYPGSQTGNPGNPMYGHMIGSWSSGDYYELEFGGNTFEAKELLHQLTIKAE